MLSRDFFSVEDNPVASRMTNNISVDGNEGLAKRITAKLKLEAIMLGQNSKAFINDKLFAIGDTLIVFDGTDGYECSVTSIEKKQVIVKCGEIEITLKLAQMTRAAD